MALKSPIMGLRHAEQASHSLWWPEETRVEPGLWKWRLTFPPNLLFLRVGPYHSNGMNSCTGKVGAEPTLTCSFLQMSPHPHALENVFLCKQNEIYILIRESSGLVIRSHVPPCAQQPFQSKTYCTEGTHQQNMLLWCPHPLADLLPFSICIFCNRAAPSTAHSLCIACLKLRKYFLLHQLEVLRLPQ